jgi:hypothetical protein
MTEQKRNNVVINTSEQWLFDGFPRPEATIILMRVAGSCNERPFEALFTYEPGIDSKVDLFSAPDVVFSTDEYQSIRRKIKASISDECVDRRGEVVPEGQRSVYGAEWERHYNALHEVYIGTRIDLNVSFADKDAVKAMGANWDGANRCWFTYSRNPYYEAGKLNGWLRENTETPH